MRGVLDLSSFLEGGVELTQETRLFKQSPHKNFNSHVFTLQLL